jgi:hypothetical protein
MPNYAQTKKNRVQRNSTVLRDTEFHRIPRNFGQFRIAYGICESKKNIWNSVLMEFRKHPIIDL